MVRTNKANSSVSSFCYIESLSPSPTSSLGLDQVSTQLGQTSFEYTQMGLGSLVLLSAGHLDSERITFEKVSEAYIRI